MSEGFNRMAPPVSAGDELEVKIESVGAKGDGIAKVEGYAIFVPETQVDDVVKIKVTKTLPNFGFAERMA